MTGKTFIETQFPVSKLSKESYKERKSHETQTLTSLGKWWGRKPLTLVRATLLGLLFPGSSDPTKDREIFLKILTMDDEGFERRCKGLTQSQIFDLLTEEQRKKYFKESEGILVPILKDRDRKEDAQALVLKRLTYDEKLNFSHRPEEIEGPSKEAWEEINAHLGTKATSLAGLFRELGVRCFGHTPCVGDAFSGGGSIPFEAARLDLNAFGSDLNPVGALLTWASLHIVGGGKEVAEQVHAAQERIYSAVDQRIRGLEFETNEKGWRAESGKANQTRLKTASEFKRRELGKSPPVTKGGQGGDFGATLLRNTLFAVYRVAESEETREGMTWLKTELPDYWAQRENIVTLARYLGNLPMEHWEKDAAAARLLAGAVENDHV